MLRAGNNVGRGMNHSCGLPGGWGTPQVAAGADYPEEFSFFFLILPVIIGSSNSSSAWAARLFSLEYPRDGLAIHHKEIVSFSPSLFSPRWLQCSQCISTTWGTQRLWPGVFNLREEASLKPVFLIKWNGKMSRLTGKQKMQGVEVSQMPCSGKKKPFSYHGSSHNAIIPYNKINSALNCNSNDCLSFFPLAICILKSINNLWNHEQMATKVPPSPEWNMGLPSTEQHSCPGVQSQKWDVSHTIWNYALEM